MARLLGPDANSRLVYSVLGTRMLATAGSIATVYSDAAGTTLANIATYDGTATPGAVIAGSTLAVDANSLLPKCWFPDGVDTVWVQVGTGPVTAVNADYDARLDVVTAPLRGVDGRHYRTVIGVIRNAGSSSSYWQPISDANHRPHNIDSVTTDASSIIVNYASLGATRVASLVVFPDETLAAAGIMAGASVTATAATITLSRPAALADYVLYNGTSWVSQNGVFTGLTFAAGVLSLTHASMEDPANPFVTYYGVSVTGRGPGLVAMVSGDVSGVTNTGLKVSWFDWAGTLQTVPSTNMKAFVTRSAPKAQAMNPQAVDTTAYPSSNLWIIGVFEVAS